MKYEIKIITIDNNHSTIEEYELSEFHFKEISDYLTLIEEHKKMLEGVKNE